jgi:hypoxanthine phosphoribosyltransferase
MISHKLSIPYVDRINKDTLVVDDICDTGETLKKSIAMYTATLHYKPTAGFTPDFYSKEVGTEWIVYPWERKDSDAVQDYLKK